MLKSLFGKFKGKNRETSSADFPIDSYFDEIIIQREATFRNQSWQVRRSEAAAPLLLGEVLELVFGLGRDDVESMAEIVRCTLGSTLNYRLISEPVDIMNYDLFDALFGYKSGERQESAFTEITLALKAVAGTYILTLVSCGGKRDGMLYMRLTYMMPDPSAVDDGRSMDSTTIGNRPMANHLPAKGSMLLAHTVDKAFEKQMSALYDRVEQSAQRKIRSPKELDRLEDNLVSGAREFHDGWHYFGYGQWLHSNQRYYDALSMLMRQFRAIRPLIDEEKQDLMGLYQEMCLLIGDCLTHLYRDVEAAYFLKQGVAHLKPGEPNPLASCLARLGNPSAMRLMFNWMNMSPTVERVDNQPMEVSNSLENQLSDVREALSSNREQFKERFLAAQQETDTISLGYVLKTLFGTAKASLTPPLTVIDAASGALLQTVEDADAVYDYVLNRPEAIGRIFCLSVTHSHVRTGDTDDRSILSGDTPLVIATHAVSVPGSDVAMRVDIMRSNFSNDDDKLHHGSANNPLWASFCLGLSAGAKFGMERDHLPSLLSTAVSMIDNRRFMEAQKLGCWVYETASYLMKDYSGARYESDDEELWTLFYDACFHIGFSLLELNCSVAAGYYLELASRCGDAQYVQEYINFLVNSGDPQALSVIDDVEAHTPMSDDPEVQDMLRQHIAFLRRRKAWILVDKKRFDEAVPLLEEMLADPLTAQFAQGELNYIRSAGRR